MTHHAGRQRDGGGEGRVSVALVVGLHLQRAHGDQQPAPARARPPQKALSLHSIQHWESHRFVCKHRSIFAKEALTSLSYVTGGLEARLANWAQGCVLKGFAQQRHGGPALVFCTMWLASAMPGAHQGTNSLWQPSKTVLRGRRGTCGPGRRSKVTRVLAGFTRMP